MASIQQVTQQHPVIEDDAAFGASADLINDLLDSCLCHEQRKSALSKLFTQNPYSGKTNKQNKPNQTVFVITLQCGSLALTPAGTGLWLCPGMLEEAPGGRSCSATSCPQIQHIPAPGAAAGGNSLPSTWYGAGPWNKCENNVDNTVMFSVVSQKCLPQVKGFSASHALPASRCTRSCCGGRMARIANRLLLLLH